MKYILGNHWTVAPEGWIILKEEDQDMTKRLQWEDSSVDAIYQEHCHEHLPFEGGIHFFKESFRVLKPGGILRTICPFIEKFTRFENDELGQAYARQSTIPYYPNEEKALNEMGLSILDDPLPFIVDGLLKKHNHQFVWTTKLMSKVLFKIGFQVNVTLPGMSAWDPSMCHERRIRGTPYEVVWDKKLDMYDPESLVVEARKP